MIEIKNLRKIYDQKEALKKLDLTINDGEIFGLIGHNGAGKSTTIKALVSVLNPTSGEIVIDGLNLNDNRHSCKEKIYYIPDNPDMFLTMSAFEYWSLIANAYGLTKKDKEERIEKYTTLFNMEKEIHSAIESFSHGMRQKTFIIAALIANPKYWIMDEPLTGLDPQASHDLKQLMKYHTEQGNSVLFSTHVLEVAEKLCHRIGILRRGELIFVGTLDELRALHPGETLEDIYLTLIKNLDAQEG